MHTSKKFKRKASIPAEAKHPIRLTQSVGPASLNQTVVDGATSAGDALTTAAHTTNVSVTKGDRASGGPPGPLSTSAYPNYFYTPKENIFESRKASRYDKGQPKSFHLTQVDTNLAKFVFMNN